MPPSKALALDRQTIDMIVADSMMMLERIQNDDPDIHPSLGQQHMGLAMFRVRSLKARVSLFTLAIFLVSIWAVALYASQILRNDMQKLLGNQQFTTLSYLAAQANRLLIENLTLLGNNAVLIDPQLSNNPKALSEFLEERPVLLNQFTGGIIVLGRDGTVLFEYPQTGRAGLSYMDTDSVAAALNAGQTTIGSPVIDPKMQVPVLVTAAPIRDQQGAVIGALAGIINLNAPSFLDQIVEKYNGNGGYYLLEDPKNRLIISGTGKRRIMEALPSPGLNPLADRFIQGNDETGVTVDTTGVEILASAKRVNVADWYLVSALPTEEAFAQIYSLQQRMLLAAFFLTLLSGGLSWGMLRRELSPLFSAVKTLAALSETNLPPQALPITTQNEIGELIGAFNRLLASVAQRETELHSHVEQLTELNHKLEDAQNQLLQSEKMASVGQLAAGVAHEINNPIGFINSNLGTLKGQVNDLLNVTAAYQNAEPALAEHAELLAAIRQAKTAADLEFLQEDIPNLINESIDGVQRVKKIIDNLKDFSRVDTAEWQYANLERGLESTLSIAWNELKYKAEIVREYAGLPEIECIASQVNQVFLNLLVNAAHAIAEHGIITLRTGFDDEQVWVEIGDTGTGIKPEHLKKIFDPFFTTKPVGKGTGLGLSLAYSIVKRHHGRLDVRSEPGKGSVFRLALPRVKPETEDKA